jgi:hypothetical protein
MQEEKERKLLIFADKFCELLPSTKTGKRIILLFVLYIIAPALQAAAIGLWLWLFAILANNL